MLHRRFSLAFFCASLLLSCGLVLSGDSEKIHLFLIGGGSGSSPAPVTDYQNKVAQLKQNPAWANAVEFHVYDSTGASADGSSRFFGDVSALAPGTRKVAVGYSWGVGRIRDAIALGAQFDVAVTIDGTQGPLGGPIKIEFGDSAAKVINILNGSNSVFDKTFGLFGTSHSTDPNVPYAELYVDKRHGQLLEHFLNQMDGLEMSLRIIPEVDPSQPPLPGPPGCCTGSPGTGIPSSGEAGVESKAIQNTDSHEYRALMLRRYQRRKP